MKKRFTHRGVVRGCDARTPSGYQYQTALRETKMFWVTVNGVKYRKRSGRGIGDWPMYQLDIDSIIPISPNGKDDTL